MKLLLAILFLGAVSSVLGQQYPQLRGELIRMEKVDQEARSKCSVSIADEQIRCLADVARSIDGPNTKRITEIFDLIGFPDSDKVGKDGMQAFMIVLQHSPSDGLRVRALRPITRTFRSKELDPMAYANFVDRLRLHQGKKQLYGTGFAFKDGKMILSATKDLKHLEKRRAKIGLPPMSQAVKMMKEIYHLEIVYP